MQIKICDKIKEFQPIKIEMTFESMKEIRDLQYCIHHHYTLNRLGDALLQLAGPE